MTSEAMSKCAFCGEPLTAGRQNGREVLGWEAIRSQGGGHGLTSRTETGRVCCHVCLRRMQQGLLSQPDLFG